VMKQGGSSAEERIEYAFRLAAGRRLSASEKQLLVESLARQMREFAANKDAAAKLLKTGESPRDESLDVVEHAAYTGLCSVILNLDEVLSKE
jgi:hypothetical protein